jgi:UDP-glucose 4-epimerase
MSKSQASKPYALVTGAAGFLGAHVCRAIQNLDCLQLIALDDLSGGFEENLPPGIDFVKGSVTDPALLERLFLKYRFQYVYHLAAYAAEGLSHFIRRFNYINNLIGSVNLINEAVKNDTKCFVFTSSIAVYGSIEPPMVEDKAPAPEDPYGIAKYAVEMDLRVAEEMFGLPHIIFRPHNVYGEYQNLSDPYRNVVGIFMKQIRENRPLSIFGDGTQTRAFSYVGDIAPVIARSPFVPEAMNEIFNIGADSAYTVNELADAVSTAMGAPNHPRSYLAARQEVLHAYSDHTKVRRVFGLGEPTKLATGLAQMVDWSRSAPLRSYRGFSDIEVTKNMPPSWTQYQASARQRTGGT